METTENAQAVVAVQQTTSRARRAVEVALFVAAWMALGFAFGVHRAGNELRESENGALYMLIGVPLLLVFQLAIKRKPLRALWVRNAPPFRLGWKGGVIAVILMLMPMTTALGDLADSKWFDGLFNALAVIGAVGAAYAIRACDRSTGRLLLTCLLVVGALDIALGVVLRLVFALPNRPFSAGGFGIAAIEFFIFIPICFMFEEVHFRGLLDAHIHHSGESRGWVSAAFVSFLWGLWHLPILHIDAPIYAQVLLVSYIHIPLGIALAFYWRRSGNLLVPAVSHAFIDAIRDGFGL